MSDVVLGLSVVCGALAVACIVLLLIGRDVHKACKTTAKKIERWNN